jgi:hypothetical protein
MRPRTGWLVLGVVAAVSCAPPAAERTKELTQRERDSILSVQPLPGAGTVGRALDASDAQRVRAAGMDSLP